MEAVGRGRGAAGGDAGPRPSAMLRCPAEVPSGPLRCRVVTPRGISNPGLFWVGRPCPTVAEVEPNDAFGKPTSGPYTCDPSGSLNALPESLEISVKALSAEAARTVAAATAGRADGYEGWKGGDNAAPASGEIQLYNNLIHPNG